jgi:hypothetical protein
MSFLSHSTMSNITRSATSNELSFSSSSAASGVGLVPPAIPTSVQGVVGAAAFLQVHGTQAAVIATTAANDAVAVSSDHNIIIDKHRTMFLQRAFGIKPNGTAVDQALLLDRLKKYKSVKTIDQYNNMVRCLSHWRDDEYLAAALEDDMEASRIYRFRRQHPQGYNYCENILCGYLYVSDIAFVILKGIYGFKFPKRFLEISSRDLTSFPLQRI